jgi:hypothetical protein
MFDPKVMPQQALDSVRAVRSNQGEMQMLLVAPQVVIHDKPEKRTVYPKGVEMHIFDNNAKPTADIYAAYACSYDEKKLIIAKDSVVIIDFRTGDTSYLKSIEWNSATHRISSNDPIKSVNGQRVTFGDGFESDDNFNEPRILRQRGTMTFDE